MWAGRASPWHAAGKKVSLCLVVWIITLMLKCSEILPWDWGRDEK